MSKEENKQDAGATAFDYSNNMNPWPYSKAYYGDQYVPSPTNNQAKITYKKRVMEQVNKGK